MDARILIPEENIREPCECPVNTKGEVPLGSVKDVFLGNIQPYRDWVAHGGDVNAGTSAGFTYLYASCCGGHTQFLQEILQHPQIHVNTRCFYDYTILMAAARWGYEKYLETILLTVPRSNCRLNITAKDRDGLTALAIAAQYKRWNILPYLLIPSIEYDKKNLDITLENTMQGKQWDLVVYLLQNYTGFSNQRLFHVLFDAIKAKETRVLKTVLDHHYNQCDTKSLDIVRGMAATSGYRDAEILLTSAINVDYSVPSPLVSKPNTTEILYDCGDLRNRFLGSYLPIEVNHSRTTDGRPLTDELPSMSPVSQNSFDSRFMSSDSQQSTSPQQTGMPQIGRLELSVIPVQTPIPPGPDVYDTTSIPRGIVLILNYNEFEDRPDMLREGSYWDVLNLRNLCDQMGYQTQVHYNLTKEQTMETLDSFRKQVRLGRVSCIMLAIMTHGISRHTFYTSDMNTVTVNEVQALFLDNQCPLLKNKPKIFLFNFCRGLNIPASLDTDAVREQPRNIICIYSTTESFLSYRDKNKGCPFIIALCQVLADYAHELDLDNLIRRFQQKYLPNTTPEIQNLGFHKKFFFNPTGPQNRQRYFM